MFIGWEVSSRLKVMTIKKFIEQFKNKDVIQYIVIAMNEKNDLKDWTIKTKYHYLQNIIILKEWL